VNDIMTLLRSLKRPRLLIQAARIGGEHYRRDVHLPRVLGHAVKPRGGRILIQLVDLEAEHDEKRRAGDPGYNIAAHVEVLSAMMGEARLLRAQISRAAEAPADRAAPALSVVCPA